MAKRGGFQIEIMGHPVSLADWDRALAAPRSELPALDDDQKKEARKFREPPEEYARRELAGRYGEERVRGRAGLLGEIVAEMLEQQGRDNRLLAVIADMFKERWILTIKTPKGTANVAVPRELGDEIVDWGFREQMEELKDRVLMVLASINLWPSRNGDGFQRAICWILFILWGQAGSEGSCSCGTFV